MQSKIVFAGLSSSGKTSMILSLGKKFSLIRSVKPTMGAERSEEIRFNFLGLDIVNWDLGGQEIFRSQYFKQKYRIFSETTALFYLIDIQEPDTYKKSLDYLKDIVKTFQDLNERPLIVICFHKYDPDLKKGLNFDDNLHSLQKILPNIIKEFEFLVFQTSIYDEDSILRAFSQAVISRSPKSNLIKNQMKEFSRP